MTKEITKAIILQEMQDKLKLREFDPAAFLFDETVVPIYNIEQHLLKWEVKNKTMTITSAAQYLFFTVPPNEQWTLRSYMVIYGGTGAHKGTGLFMDTRPSIPANFIYLDMTKGQEVSYLVKLSPAVILHPGTRLLYLIDSYTSTQNLSIYIDVQKEEIR